LPGPLLNSFDQHTLDLSDRAKAIDRWAGRVRRFRVAALDAAIFPDADMLREELSVAEEELRAQHDELVTARITAEREQYRQLFDSAPVAYVITDVAGTIQTPNAACAVLFGVETERLTGKPLQVFINPDVRTDFRTDLTRLVASGESSGTMRVTFFSRDLIPHESLCVIGVSRDAGLRATELRWLIIPEAVALREERERLLAESERARIAAESANRAKTELLATVSHELRTPLTAIGGYTELLALGLRGPLTPEQGTDVDRIHRAQQHMTTLLDDLLMYFRLGLGGLSATVAPASISDMLTGLTAFVAPQANQRRITVAVPTGGQDSLRVLADVDRGRQILINLLTNAVKYASPNGSVELRVLDRDDKVWIEVQDDGPGIPPDRLESVFEPFVQLEGEAAGRGGFGLGLAISRKLAELMGGSIDVRSEIGQGSCFVFSVQKAH
jgi:signal transduction histidine kinase